MMVKAQQCLTVFSFYNIVGAIVAYKVIFCLICLINKLSVVVSALTVLYCCAFMASDT